MEKHEEYHSDGRLSDHLQELYNRSQDNLTDTELGQVRELLIEFQEVFSKSSMDLGRTSLVKHSIDIQGAMPIRQPPRKIPLAKKDEAEGAVQEMQRQGVIEPSRSPWSSPLVLVRKRDGTTRAKRARHCLLYTLGLFATPMYLLRLTTIFENGGYIRAKAPG